MYYRNIKGFIYNRKTLVIVTIAFLFLFIPRVFYLGFDTYGFDSNFWDQRSDKFVTKLLEGDFDKTYRSYHPGVTVMYLSGFSKYIFQNLVYLKYGYKIRLADGVVYAKWFYINHFASIFPLVLVMSLVFTALIYILFKLKVPIKLILIFTFLLGFEPFLLGISRFLHVTALETTFIFSHFLLVFLIAKRPLKKILWVVAGILLGLGFLTKVSALIVLPFSALVLFFPILKLNNKQKALIKDLILRTKAYAVVLISAFVTIVALWPALWVNFYGTLNKIFTKGVEGDALNATPAPTILNQRFLFYPEVLFTRATGLTFISFVVSLFLVFKEKNKILKQLLILNIAFVFYYFVIMGIPDKKIDRYITDVFPSVLFCSSYVFYKIYKVLEIKFNQIAACFFLTLVGCYYLLNFYIYFPNFSIIHSDLFGGLSGYSKIAKVKNRGEYYINAVMFLNKKDSPLGDKAVYKNLIVPNGGKDKSAQGYLGKIFTDAKYVKVGKADYYLPDYVDRFEEIPKDKNCKLLSTFGPRWPLKFDYLYLYECN